MKQTLNIIKVAVIIALFIFFNSCQIVKNSSSRNVLKQLSCPKF